MSGSRQRSQSSSNRQVSQSAIPNNRRKLQKRNTSTNPIDFRSRSSQSGGRYNSLWGQNLPFFYDTASPNYFNNQTSWSDTGLSPVYTDHGTVGQGQGKGLNYGQTHYSLPMSGGRSRNERNRSQLGGGDEQVAGQSESDDSVECEHQSQSEYDNCGVCGKCPDCCNCTCYGCDNKNGILCGYCERCYSCLKCDRCVDCDRCVACPECNRCAKCCICGDNSSEDEYNAIASEVANEMGIEIDSQDGGNPSPLPWRWFNPSGSPVISPISGNHPSLTMVGGQSQRQYRRKTRQSGGQY